MELLIVSVASLFAGFVDAIVGGGGLILVPALFAVFPTTAPATLFGVNKGASIWGTAVATAQYARRVELRWPVLLPAAALGFVGSLGGAWLVTIVAADFLRKALPFVLLGVLTYTVLKKDLGRHHAPRLSGRAEVLAACCIGGVLGFYDGFFGPGTGSLLLFAFVGLFGYDFIAASASAKLVNVATNVASLFYFASTGQVLYKVALPMAACNMLGSTLGARLAQRKGTGFVRVLFLGVVSAFILKLGWDTFGA